MPILTGNDEIILLAILALGDEAYGATLMKHLSRVTGREWSIGAIYDPLYRLEKTGFVLSAETGPTSVRGGRSRRVYSVTAAGRAALREQDQVRAELTARIPDVYADRSTE
jgi:DNA-binding PadR family transcriptional regulator